MAVHEKATPLWSAQTKVTNGVAAAVVDRFVELVPGGADCEIRTLVPGAFGDVPVGILGMKADVLGVPNPGVGLVTVGVMNNVGAQGIIELGEICGEGVNLRVGGNGAEVDGAAYLADASGDVIVGKSLEAGVVGQKIAILYLGYAGKVP